jgi:N-acetylneuraminate synthase
MVSRDRSTVRIGDATIGGGARCFVVAEAGVNHNGSLDLAMKLVDAAAAAGADAVKFQTFKAEKLVTAAAAKAAYQERATGGGSQLEMLARLQLTETDHRTLIAHCAAAGLMFLSTPFEEESADFLVASGVPALKVSSGDLTNLPFLEHLASKHLPVLLSTGMATLAEVHGAVAALSAAPAVVLLHCVSNYPADPADVNLRAMETMRQAFGVPVGYSDHTEGLSVALAAVALGADVLEKHFTLDRTLPGPDHRASIEPDELARLVKEVRIVQRSLGHGRKEPAPSEASTAAAARKSLVAACDVTAGTVLRSEHIAVKRPGTGIPPSMRAQLLGRTVRVGVPSGTLYTLEMLE